MACRLYPRFLAQERAVRLSVSLNRGSRLACSERFSLDAEVNVDPELFFRLFQHRDHDFGSVVDCKDDVFDSSLGLVWSQGWNHLDKGFDLMQAERSGPSGMSSLHHCLDVSVCVQESGIHTPCCKTRPEVWATTAGI